MRDFYEREFAPLGGTVRVEVDARTIEVTWEAESSDEGLLERALRALHAGQLREAVSLLQALTAVEPRNVDAHYNLGMALSDLGQLEDAKLHLVKVVHLAPEHANALTALGVALYRSGDPQAARRRLEQAVAADPANGYARRNLGAVLGNLGETAVAEEHLRAAYQLLPHDQQAVYGLARWLLDFGGAEAVTEADRLLREVIAIDADSQFAELARRERSQLAQQGFRSATTAPRMDAVMYCLGALERFATMTPKEVQGVAFEIAMLGQRGIDVHNPEREYTLRTLPGSFTGLHLMSLMYTAFQQVAPETDIGFDLSAEYKAAKQLFEGYPGRL